MLNNDEEMRDPKAMQSDVTKEEYNKKIEDLIEFFKTLRDTYFQNYNIIKGSSEFYHNSFISFYAVFIAIMISLMSLDKFIGLVSIMVFIIIFAFFLNKDSKKRELNNKNYFYKIISCDTVIKFLYTIKISQTEVDLSPLFTKIELPLCNNRIYSKEDYHEIWIREVIASLDDINNELIAKKNLG